MIGRLELTANADKRGGASSTYHRVLVENGEGQLENLLLTPTELGRARERAEKNTEDTREATLIESVLHWLCSLLS
tara:strand:- start:460 stop:687 length:228 start_codon:yes stop_codon:yes gene_type:complete